MQVTLNRDQIISLLEHSKQVGTQDAAIDLVIEYLYGLSTNLKINEVCIVYRPEDNHTFGVFSCEEMAKNYIREANSSDDLMIDKMKLDSAIGKK